MSETNTDLCSNSESEIIDYKQIYDRKDKPLINKYTLDLKGPEYVGTMGEHYILNIIVEDKI